MTDKQKIKLLQDEIKLLKSKLLKRSSKTSKKLKTVIVPKEIEAIFEIAEKNVGSYHKSFQLNPEKGSIEISGQRYVLIRASALSIEFLEGIMKYYRDRGETEALAIGKNILFDLAHLIGVEDALNFSKLMGLSNPIEMLSAGPVHFAYTGWAQVKILEGSNPSPDENFLLRYTHPYSFEADSWLKAGKKNKQPVCVMNSGYSSGWCSHSFGINLTSVEITCRAKGDAECTFIMAPPEKIQNYLEANSILEKKNPEVPIFLQRKIMEEKLSQSLLEKELLLKEVHHRVKNNLQIISSLLNLQLNTIQDETVHRKFRESIDRVRSMATVHDLLYRSNDLAHIQLTSYFPLLINSLKESYHLKNEIAVELNIKMLTDKFVIEKAIPCGLILNEIVSNAFKYAFKGVKDAQIKISFSEIKNNDASQYELLVIDNGIGFVQEPFTGLNKTLGLELIHSLVLQLDGQISIMNSNGTTIRITF
jgi:two-component sensor histidine kinase